MQKSAGILTWLFLILTGQPVFPIPYLISAIGLIFCITALQILSGPGGLAQRNSFISPRSTFLALITCVPLLSGVLHNSWSLTRTFVIVICSYAIVTFSKYSQSFIVSTFTTSVVITLFLCYISLILQSDSKVDRAGYSYNILEYRFSGILSHPNYLGALCTITLILNLGKTLLRGQKPMLLLSLILSEHRIGLLAVVFCFLIFQLNFSEKKQSRVIKKILILVSMALFLPFFFSRFIFQSRGSTTDVLTGRGQIWELCLEKSSTNLFSGLGPSYIKQFYGLDPLSSLQVFSCHNQFLDDTLNYGIFYSVLVFTFVSYMIVNSFRVNDQALFFLAITISLLGITEVPIQMASVISNAIPAVLLTSIFLSRENPRLRKDSLMSEDL